MNDFNEDITFYAFRYALCRKTYAVQDVTNYLIENWYRISSKTKMLIIEEINKAIKENQAGMSCDIVRWKSILLLEEVFKDNAENTTEVKNKQQLNQPKTKQ